MAERAADLVVGVGGGDHVHRGGEACGLIGPGRDGAPDAGHAGGHAPIGPEVAGTPGDDVHRPPLGEGGEEGAGGDRQPLREVDDHGAEGGDGDPALPDGGGGGGQEIGLVVPPIGELAGDVPVDARHVGRAPRRLGDGRRRAASPASRSSRWAATSASSVAGCSRTASKQPGTWRRAWRTAPATTGVDTGRRPAPASRAEPSSSARRYTVRNDTPARPSRRARARRVATPT